MKTSALRIPLLALLVLVPTASRLAASGDPPNPEKKTEKKKIVISSPEKEIVVDGDRIAIWGDPDEDFGPEVLADLPDFDDGHFPGVHVHALRSGGYMGVRSVEMTPELREHFGAPKDAGVLVGTVEADGPAAKAGLQVADVITAVDGEEVGSTRELSRSIRRHKDGEKVKLDVVRDRVKKSLTVTVVERKDSEIRVGDLRRGVRGFHWKDWDPDLLALAPVPPVPPVPPVAPVAPDGSRWNGLRDRLNSLEQRLKELERRLPPQ